MRKIFNFRPILIGAVCLCFGILSAYLFALNKIVEFIVVISLFAVSFILAVLLTFKAKKVKKPVLVFTIFFLVMFLLGYGLFTIQIKNYEKETLNNQTLTFSGNVVDISEGQKSLGVVIDRVEIKETNKTLKNKVAIYLPLSTKISLGDNVEFSAKLSERSIVYDGRFNASSVIDGIKFSTYIDDDDVLIKNGNPTLFQKITMHLKDVLKGDMGNREYPVAFAMLFGNSDYIESDLLSSYRSAGIAHMFAISGMHIGFLAMALNFALTKLRVNKYVKTVSIVGILLFYSGICSFSASSLRAVIMTAVILTSRLFGKKYDALTSISFAGIILLLISPSQLFAVGFQLSFGVVLGIALLSQKISKLFRFLPKKFANSLGAVLSAQIASFPIMLATFKSASVISILFNLIFLPIASVVFILTIVLLILTAIFGCGSVFMFIPNAIFAGLNYLMSIFDYSALMIGGFSFGACAVFYYGIVFISSGTINLRRCAKVILSVSFSIILICGTIFSHFSYKNSPKIAVSYHYTSHATCIYTKEESVLVISYASRSFSAHKINNLMADLRIDKFDKLVLLNCGDKFDVQQTYSAIHDKFMVDKVYYFGEQSHALELSFPYTDFENCSVGQEICQGNLSLSHNGEYVKGRVQDKSFIIFATDIEYDNDLSKNDCDIIIAGDNLPSEFIGDGKKLIITYKHSAYKNSETLGNIVEYLT